MVLLSFLLIIGLLTLFLFRSFDLLLPSHAYRVRLLNMEHLLRDARIYEIDSERVMLYLMIKEDHKIFLLINKQSEKIYRMSNQGIKFGKILLWPEDSYKGVYLKDRVKMEALHDFIFQNEEIQINYYLDKQNKVTILVQKATSG